MPRILKPALGGLLTGAVGVGLYFVFREDVRTLAVLSTGYGILQDAVSPQTRPDLLWGAALLLAVALGKILTTGLSIGSGGSGGVFGPSMVIGGLGGGAPGRAPPPARAGAGAPPAGLRPVGVAGLF